MIAHSAVSASARGAIVCVSSRAAKQPFSGAAGYVVNSLLGTTEGTFQSATINGDAVEPGALFLRGTGVDLVFL